MNGFETNSYFAIKAYMKWMPMAFLTCCCAFSIFYFGLAVRNFEKPLIVTDKYSHHFRNHWNAFWQVILTMTTVGYGDIYPLTTAGRLATIIACIWGMFVVSTITATLTNIISLSKEEDAVYGEVIDSVNNENRLKGEAVDFIQAWFKFMYSRKRKLEIRVRMKARTDFILNKNRFAFKREMISYVEPQMELVIEDLQRTIDQFRINGTRKMKVFRNHITRQVNTIRQNQFDIDTKMMKIYDQSFKLGSYLKYSNDHKEVVQDFDNIPIM
jgi:hypothetical protein